MTQIGIPIRSDKVTSGTFERARSNGGIQLSGVHLEASPNIIRTKQVTDSVSSGLKVSATIHTGSRLLKERKRGSNPVIGELGMSDMRRQTP